MNARIDGLTQENQLLRDDNTRLKSIINNDGSNTSLPPSTDQKGHKVTTLSKTQAEEKIAFDSYRHLVRNIGDVSSGEHISKYIMDIDITPVITEVRIYADGSGKYNIRPNTGLMWYTVQI